MKTFFTTAVMAIALILGHSTVSAQNDKFLSGIEYPQNFETIDLINMDRNLSTFANLVRLSGLEFSAEMSDSHTVFAPTNEAFYDMSVEEFAYLTNPDNKMGLIKFVKSHFLNEEVTSDGFSENQMLIMAQGEDIPVSIDEAYNQIYIGATKVIQADITASNGTLHIVDGVIKSPDGIAESK